MTMIMMQSIERRRWSAVAPSMAVCPALAIACIVMATGCAGSPSDIVIGRVTYRSQPVAGGRIYFNVGDGASVQSAAIASDGSYVVKGLTPGMARVAVMGPEAVLPPGGGDSPVAGTPRQDPVIPIPEKYGRVETSGIEVRVEPGTMTHDIVLE